MARIVGCHISVCICTYKRPSELNRLLKALQKLKNNGLFSYDVVIVDNDASGSARDVVTGMELSSPFPIYYHIEPDQNISLARNKGLTCARGDYLACIDDDEVPDDMWLVNLYLTAKKYGSDGVLGPVKPFFEIPPPGWITRGGFFERESFPTGTFLHNAKHTRSGNFLIDKRIVEKSELLFDPRYGRTGGEDVDFFKRMISHNFTFVWCNEAQVNEVITPARLRRSYFLRRALLRGVVNARQAPLLSADTLKSVIAFVSYTLIIPPLFFYRHDLFLSYLIRDCDHIGKLIARCGIRLVKERAD